MTFIASVIARDGIAIVADSFTTSVRRSLDFNDFTNYLKDKKEGEIDLKELVGLFKQKPSFTQNYTDKLVKFDDYTAITSAGQAFINGRRTKEVLLDVSKECSSIGKCYEIQEIEKTLEQICECIKKEVLEHLKTYKRITSCSFIVSHFNIKTNEPKVFKIKIMETNQSEIDEDPNLEFIGWRDETQFGVVSDGQDRIIDRLLFGSLYTQSSSIIKHVSEKIYSELKTDEVEQARINSILSDAEGNHILDSFVKRDIRMIRLRQLSLQEAINLAALLMRIVRDIQIYTENIPTVGGLIKVATINKDKGFKYLTGDKLIVPNIVH